MVDPSTKGKQKDPCGGTGTGTRLNELEPCCYFESNFYNIQAYPSKVTSNNLHLSRVLLQTIFKRLGSQMR